MNQKIKQRIFSAFLAAPLILAGCGGDKKTSTLPSDSTESKRRQGVNLEACQFAPTEGGPAAPSAEKIESLFFGKKLNISHLNAILESSTKATYDYIRSIGVNVFEVSSEKEGECEMMSLAEDAPAPHVDVWNSMAEDGLAGLYLPKGYLELFSGQKNEQPVVWIHKNATRWTLVHEFMHHLYDKAESLDQKESRVSLAKTSEEWSESWAGKAKKVAKALKRDSTSETHQKNFIKQMNIAVDILIRYPLEELAIEAQLFDLHSKGQLKYVPDFEAQAALTYGMDSAREAFSQSEVLQTQVSKVVDSTWPNPKDVPKLISDWVKSLDDLQDEIDSLYLRLEKHAGSGMRLRNARILGDSKTGNKLRGCSHVMHLKGIKLKFSKDD